MKTQGILAALTVANFVLLSLLLAGGRPAEAGAKEQVLRGRALEIVDDLGRVRASILVQKPDPKYKKPNGKPYPETVMLRLVDPNGKPNVKLGASVDGAGLGLGGETDPTYIQVIADGPETLVRLTNKDGRVKLVHFLLFLKPYY